MELRISLGILSVVFLILTVAHIINYRYRFNLEFHPKIAKINGISLGTSEFAKEVNSFIDDINKSHKRANLIPAVGYFAAFLGVLIDLLISW